MDNELESKHVALNVGRCLTVKGMCQNPRVLSNATSIMVVIWVVTGGIWVQDLGCNCLGQPSVLQPTTPVSIIVRITVVRSRCI